MLAGCGLTLIFMLGAGGAMINHSWREAQREEMQSAIRAAISATGSLLSGAGDVTFDEQLEKRIEAFAEAVMPGLDASAVVTFKPSEGVTTVEVSGTYAYSNLWSTGDTVASDSTPIDPIEMRVKLDADAYEVAVALDLSYSMGHHIVRTDSSSDLKIDALKRAMDDALDVMRASTEGNHASLMVSLVPFASTVKVADTAGDGQTAGKERYLRMLAGTPEEGQEIGDTLAAAKEAVRRGWGHWTDSFHQYGVGADLGELRKRSLPQGLLDGTDWNLRRTDVAVDVSRQVPALGTWVVNDEDFWNGCVMARWGAYWQPEAQRRAGWRPPDAEGIVANPNLWPAKKAVDGWSPKGKPLPAGTPLHLADAPPDKADFNTLFTAYSWPDARIGGHADHRLQTVMATLLEAPAPPEVGRGRKGRRHLRERPTVADNDWSKESQRGAALCMASPVTPLDDDVGALKTAVADLKVECRFPGSRPDAVAGSSSHCPPEARPGLSSATYLHLGVVWALRTLSPLWQRVWDVEDVQGTSRPVVSCAEGDDPDDCRQEMTKSILIVSDGSPNPGMSLNARLRRAPDPVRYPRKNAVWKADELHCVPRDLRQYHAAAAKDDRNLFDARFQTYLDGGTFGGGRIDDVVAAFRILDRFPTVTPAQLASRKAVLRTLSPWRLFRGLDAQVTDALMDEANAFGFNARPVQMGHFCRPTSLFGPYGRLGDMVYVGDGATPVRNAAPFHVHGWPSTKFQLASFKDERDINRLTEDPLQDWFVEACAIAAERGVRIHAIFIGNDRAGKNDIKRLEKCVDMAGGAADHRDVLVTPDAAALANAFAARFAVRRTLRFLE